MRPALSNPTGVGIYLLNLVGALAKIDSTNEYHLFSSSWKERYAPPRYGANFRIHDRRWPVSILNFTWHRFSLPSIETLTGTGLDIAHSPGPLMMPARNAHRIITVHDLYFYIHPEQTSREIRRDYGDLVRKHCEQADAIIAISDATRQQLIQLLNIPPSRICTIRHGADPFFAVSVPKTESEAVLKKYGVQRPFFLYAGSREPRKNLPNLLTAFNTLEDDVQMVLAGPRDPVSVSQARVLETGYVTREELRALYQEALALVLVSLEEGFGLPLLEAMQAGVPVVASDLPAFREVGGDAYLKVDGRSTEEITAALRRIREDENLRRQLAAAGRERAAGFTWEETARKTLELYQTL